MLKYIYRTLKKLHHILKSPQYEFPSKMDTTLRHKSTNKRTSSKLKLRKSLTNLEQRQNPLKHPFNRRQ